MCGFCQILTFSWHYPSAKGNGGSDVEKTATIPKIRPYRKFRTSFHSSWTRKRTPKFHRDALAGHEQPPECSLLGDKITKVH
jgi:hypothetical protein